MKCSTCGAEMKALLTSVYCPLEDKHGAAPVVTVTGGTSTRTITYTFTIPKGGLHWTVK